MKLNLRIEVVNQGDVAIKTIALVDYMPENTTITDDSWTVDNSDPSNLTAYKEILFPDGLKPGGKHKETISMIIGNAETTGLLVNEAEIALVIDMNGNDVSNMDVDSQADMDNSNDAGGDIGTGVDDYLDGNGIDDEDDHDPAGLYIATIEVEGACVCENNATSPFNGHFTETILVTAPPGQTWFIDFAVDIFDPTSMDPPALPMPFCYRYGGI